MRHILNRLLGILDLALLSLGLERAKPMSPAPPAPAAPQWRLPHPEALDDVRAHVAMYDSPYVNAVKICRGPGKGCAQRPAPRCPDCYTVYWSDRRTSVEILRSMERGDA